MIDGIAKAFQEGGEFMYFITLTSGFALAVILDRMYFLLVKFRADTDTLVKAVTKSLRDRQVDRKIVQYVAGYQDSPIGQVALSVVARADKPGRFIRDRMFEQYLKVTPPVTQRTGYLSMLGNVATLLGLLGTILGLIQAFEGVAAADPAHKQAMLASGIAVAMNTTAYGLMVAIPCIVSHALLTARIGTIMNDIDTIRQRVQAVLDLEEKQAA